MARILDVEELVDVVGPPSARRKRIVFTNGCFDVFHAGHSAYLKDAAKLGEILIVAINSDVSMLKLGKAPGRPINPLSERIEVISSLRCVDYVVAFDDMNVIELINAVKPDVFAKGSDYIVENLIEREAVEAYGGVCETIPFRFGSSTTKIIRRSGETVKKVAFLDRDGVINIDFGYVSKREDFEFIPGVFPALRKIIAMGYEIIVVTNQSGIGRGKFSLEDFLSLNQYMIDCLSREGIEVLDVFFCPHTPDQVPSCSCRKPKIGLLLDAYFRHRIDIKESFFVGDKLSDIACSRAASIGRSFLIDANSTMITDSDLMPDGVFSCLSDLVAILDKFK